MRRVIIAVLVLTGALVTFGVAATYTKSKDGAVNKTEEVSQESLIDQRDKKVTNMNILIAQVAGANAEIDRLAVEINELNAAIEISK